MGNRQSKNVIGDGATTVEYYYDVYNDWLKTETDSATSTTTSYNYDANGSLISESQVGGSTPRAATYTYNANQRLASASVSRYEDSQLIEIGTAYRYNVSGIRTEAKQTSLSIDSVAQSTLSTRHFLIDAHNPTGYAQVLEETATLGGAPAKTYTLGDDVLSQTTASTTRYLLADGHGSTRALADNNETITASHQFNHC